MGRSLSQIESEIEKLRKEAEAAREREMGDVIARIREAIGHYGITPRDLFGRALGAGSGSRLARRRGNGHGPRMASVVKYRDAAGHTWSGRGKRPNWFKEALAAGRTAEELLVR